MIYYYGNYDPDTTIRPPNLSQLYNFPRSKMEKLAVSTSSALPKHDLTLIASNYNCIMHCHREKVRADQIEIKSATEMNDEIFICEKHLCKYIHPQSITLLFLVHFDSAHQGIGI